MGNEESMNMKTFILSILGALAWMPIIIQWVQNWLKKPKITIIFGQETEIGFTELGPIFNLTIGKFTRDGVL